MGKLAPGLVPLARDPSGDLAKIALGVGDV